MEIRKEFAEKILDCDLLSKCGEKEDLEFGVEYINSEKTAKQIISNVKWKNLCLDIRGNFTTYLSRHYRMIYINWNEVTNLIKNSYIDKIHIKVESNWKYEQTKQAIVRDVQFNILTLFMLDYYSEYYKSDFFDKMLAIYLSGHLPCGWSGEYPEGKFIVY